MNRIEAQDYAMSRLGQLVDHGEAMSIARLLGEHASSLQAISQIPYLDASIERIIRGEPVQYVIGYTWFYHLKIKVNHSVLIPRPETEELVDWVVQDHRSSARRLKMLDVGTGSGCIALSLKHQLRDAEMHAVDISGPALKVAAINASDIGLEIQFHQYDILSTRITNAYDLVVSNPPYISLEEMTRISATVREYEPVHALTPGGDDSLIFYRWFADMGNELLNPGGRYYLELNEFNAEEAKALFDHKGYRTEMKKDMQGKWRMLRCLKFEV